VIVSGISRWLRSVLNGNVAAEQAPAPVAAAIPVAAEAAGRAVIQNVVPEPQLAIEVDSRSACPADVFQFGWRTDTGMVRDHNEDAVYVFTGCLDAMASPSTFGLFMVADGMGGHRDGEKASVLALKTAASQLVNGVYMPLLSDVERDAEQPALGDLMRLAGETANGAVYRNLPGSGCTLTYGMVVGSRLFLGHVGDSRAYLLREGNAPRVLTQDHSLVRRLVEVGQLTEAEAIEHPQRNVLYRAVGQPEALDVDVVTLSLEPGDYLLLCSDGLWNTVAAAEIQATVTSACDVQTACDALVNAANAAGGEDNITVLLVKTNIQY
jgi:PPM family protein phosphatase